MHFSSPTDRVGAGLRKADVTALALFDQLRHGPHRFLNRDFGIDARHAKDIETVDAESLQALLAVLRQIFGRAAAAVSAGIRRPRATGLGMDDNSLSPTLECLGDEFMIVSVTVARRRV